MIGAAVTRNSIILGVFATTMAAILATTALGTKERIAEAEKAAAAKALLEIIPLERHSNDLLVDTIPIPEHSWPLLGLKHGGEIHVARDDNGQPIGVIIPTVAPDGYSGDIKLIVGINVDGSLAGVRALTHNETPGLGDRIETKKSNWILGFNGKSLQQPQHEQWAVKKDGGVFDQFTGATITPRAVVGQVRKALEFYRQDKKHLLQRAQGSKPVKISASETKSVP